MIKYWQSMQDYKYFLNESKVHFDSSERVRLHTELWKPWQKLRLFDTDKAMEFLLPFYSNTGRPAKNQPQILRSFILFFLLFSEGLAKLSLTLWVDRLKHDRLLAALIGCTTDSLPPLGSYFDFMGLLLDLSSCIKHINTTVPVQENLLVQQIISYLEENYAKPISLDDLARHIQLSKEYTCTLFKQCMQQSIMHYLQSVRISRARIFLLQYPEKKVLDIAKMCGFESPSYFGKIFKKEMGITPENYRNSI
ncbi:HTH-type transcriptional activator RhaR [Eubacterium plexicaudatum ASF492]|uniref:HTH araC/xylS-type domain-containing protein n=1 Tax=Eubacterium plexicaudatum ASF492 TaxID=1235802 RepID=N2A7E2_9FIRM|nr:HTH-type transcriptional activator RhaR [Eubacterium plexicaudatum ASF492]